MTSTRLAYSALALVKAAQSYQESVDAVNAVPEDRWLDFTNGVNSVVATHDFKRMGIIPGLGVRAALQKGLESAFKSPPAAAKVLFGKKLDADTYSKLQKSNPDFIRGIYDLAKSNTLLASAKP